VKSLISLKCAVIYGGWGTFVDFVLKSKKGMLKKKIYIFCKSLFKPYSHPITAFAVFIWVSFG